MAAEEEEEEDSRRNEEKGGAQKRRERRGGREKDNACYICPQILTLGAFLSDAEARDVMVRCYPAFPYMYPTEEDTPGGEDTTKEALKLRTLAEK